MQPSSQSTAGLPPAPRVDPRRPALLTPAGLRRIVLGSHDGERLALPARANVPAPARPVRSPGPFSTRIAVAVWAERGSLDEAAREAIAAAALLADADCEVAVAVLGPCHEDAAALGIDRLTIGGALDREAYAPERAVAWLGQLHARWQPRAWLLPDRAADGELGRRFAVAASLRVACGVVELDHRAARVRIDAREDAWRPHAQVMLLARKVARPALPFVGLGVIEAEPVPAAAPAGGGVDDLGRSAGDPQALALEEADLILSAGNGVGDLGLFHALAVEVGAAIGASRVAVDDGRFPRGQQIGATGKSVAASGYVAIGISGAVQHLQGIKNCRHVIAVNTDAAAPIVRRADLTVVEDSTRLVQALLDAVRRAKAQPQGPAQPTVVAMPVPPNEATPALPVGTAMHRRVPTPTEPAGAEP